MGNNLAVIDLGTNTFHVLIASANQKGGFDEVYRERRFIKLAEEGIQKIGPAAYARGLECMADFAEKIEQYQVRSLRATGTAALRTASNGMDFVKDVKAKTGIQIELISGDEEARLIHQGVLRAVPFDESRNLIMDIGGGSVEFIIADEQQVFWSQSFPIGVAVLFKEFHHHNPILEEECLRIEAHLEHSLGPLLKAMEQHEVRTLIGASGTFDVLENLLPIEEKGILYSKIVVNHFPEFYSKMQSSTLEERLKMEGIPHARAEMLIVALVLINYILEVSSAQNIIVSAYAMKEGILSEMMTIKEA